MVGGEESALRVQCTHASVSVFAAVIVLVVSDMVWIASLDYVCKLAYNTSTYQRISQKNARPA